MFPVEPRGKRPLGKLAPHGLKDATVDHATIDRWWSAEPRANIGLPTGLSFDVLDVDGPEGMAALVVEMPATAEPINGPTVATGKGTHVYVVPTGLGNRAGLLPHVDWRGMGGYVVAPPSVHAAGRQYVWYCGIDDPDFGLEAPLAPVPAWLLARLVPARASSSAAPMTTARAGRHSSGVKTAAYGRRALESEVGKVMLAPEGQRNETLNRAAFALGQLIAGGVLDVDDAADALLLAAQRIGLPPTEAERTIASGLESGAAQPRGIPA